MGTRRLTSNFHVCWHIKGEKISADRVNPLVEKFIDKFMDFKIEEPGYKIYVSRCTDSIIEKVDTRLVKVSSHLTIEILDSRISNDANKLGLNHDESASIHNKLKLLSLIDGTYSHRIDINIVDTHKGSEPPQSHENSPWPTQRW